MADFDLSKITGREPPLVTDDERDAEIAYLSDVVANRDRELAALRARVAELEADAAQQDFKGSGISRKGDDDDASKDESECRAVRRRLRDAGILGGRQERRALPG